MLETSEDVDYPARSPRLKLSGEAKLFIGILVVALLLVGVAIYPLISNKTNDGPIGSDVKRNDLILPVNYRLGDSQSTYTVVVFSDFQCPSCKTASLFLREMVMKNGGKLSVIYRNFQAAEGHKASRALAQAVEAAGLQGKFWEMHDKLFEQFNDEVHDDPNSATERALKIATGLKLDLIKFRADMVSDIVIKRCQNDQAWAISHKLRYTPTFYLVPPGNGQIVRFDSLGALRDYIKKLGTLQF